MKKLFTLVLIALASVALAQTSTPPSWTKSVYTRDVPVELMPDLDIAQLLAEDEVRHAQKVGPFKFGENIPVEISAATHGVWDVEKNGNRLWRLSLRSMGAYSLNFIFSELYLPQGSAFYIYNDSRTEMYGPYSLADVRADRGFATFPMAGELIHFEYFEPAAVAGQGIINLETVTHGYRDLFGMLRGGGSGACNINVNCPQGADWQDEKRSVAIMISGGSGFCTGAMVNNTAQDGTPYFLTANHCLGGSMANWTFKFNYESTGCTNAGAPGLTGGQFTQGAQLRASNAGSDVALIQLNSTPPAAHNVYYSGWDNTGSAVPNAVGIHHPSGDIKKISFENNALTQVNWNGAACWRIAAWDAGTTEPGSSGSPLFNPDHRIIGQLFGGEANCTNNVNDYYGRFNVSWNTGSTAATRLRDWLDPQNTGATTLNGFDPNAPTVALDGGLTSVTGIAQGATQCSDQVTLGFNLRNYGQNTLTSATINWTIDGTPQTPIDWTGSLASNLSTTVNVGTLTMGAGAHSIVFTMVDVNGSADGNAANNSVTVDFTIVIGQEASVVITTDNYGDETSWEITYNGTVVASGSGYGDNTTYTIPACLGDGCYTLTVMDEYGDGMCCQYGNGSFQVLSPEGAVMGNGGQFTDEISIDFCLPFQVVAPVAQFSANNTTVCSGTTINYTNQSTPTTGATYAWAFQGGTPATSTAQNPTVTYNTAGTYNVSLTVTYAGQTATQSQTGYVTVNPKPTATATSTPVDVTTGGNNGTATVNVTGGTQPYTIVWNPGGQTGASANNLAAGNYTATITDANGCATTAQTTVASNVGISDADLAASVVLFPNPTNGLVTVELPINTQVINLQLTDVVGRNLMVVPVNGQQRMVLDLGSLSEGVYNLTIVAEGARATKRLLHLR